MTTKRIYDHILRIHHDAGFDLRKEMFGLTSVMPIFARGDSDIAVSNHQAHIPLRRIENIVVSMMFFTKFLHAGMETEAEDACLDGLRVCAHINGGEHVALATRFVCGSSGRVVEVPGATSVSATPIERLNLVVHSTSSALDHMLGMVPDGRTMKPGVSSMNRAVRITCDATLP